jgi:hypothetical protein
MIEYYCKDCGKVVAKVKESNGTFLSKSIVFLCDDCYKYLQYFKNNKPKEKNSFYDSSLGNIFGNFFNK